jgi:hypothetical protein
MNSKTNPTGVLLRTDLDIHFLISSSGAFFLPGFFARLDPR